MVMKGNTMRLIFQFFAVRGLLLVSVLLWMRPLLQAQAAKPAAAEVRMDEVSLTGAQPDRVTLRAKLEVIPSKSIQAKSFTFSAMKVNGLPVYISPLEGSFELKQGQPLRLPDLQIVVYTRDVTSVAPLREVVDHQKASLSGMITATVRANLLEEMALHSLRPRIVLPFSMEVPILIPGGEVGRRTALATLDVIGQITPAAAKLLGGFFPGEDAAWREDLSRNQSRHLVLIHTSYVVVDQATSTPFESEQIGFWAGPSTVLATEEAVAPWQFDPEMQARLAAQHTHIDKNSIAITVRPLVGSDAPETPAWTLAQGDFTIAAGGSPSKSRETFSSNLAAIKVRERASTGNYAVLRFRPEIGGDPVRLAGSVTGEDRVAMFRVMRNTDDGKIQPEVILLPGSLSGQQIQLGQPVDESAFGSPVFTRDGAVGLLQDQSSATLLSAMKHLDSQQK